MKTIYLIPLVVCFVVGCSDTSKTISAPESSQSETTPTEKNSARALQEHPNTPQIEKWKKGEVEYRSLLLKSPYMGQEDKVFYTVNDYELIETFCEMVASSTVRDNQRITCGPIRRFWLVPTSDNDYDIGCFDIRKYDSGDLVSFHDDDTIRQMPVEALKVWCEKASIPFKEMFVDWSVGNE